MPDAAGPFEVAAFVGSLVGPIAFETFGRFSRNITRK